MSNPTLEIPHPPQDTVSQLEFDPTSSKLLVGSWDGRVKVYDIGTNSLIADYCHIGPVLSCCFVKSAKVASVGADKKVYLYDLNTKADPLILGLHTDTIKCVAYSTRQDLVFTASWDKSICIWSPEQSKEGGLPLKRIELDEKPHSMSLSSDGQRLVVACDNRVIYILEGENLNLHIVQQRESSLKHPTRNNVVFPDGTSWCTSSTEGRVSVDYFIPETAGQPSNRYAFKCHRQTVNGTEYVYPVNALAVYPQWGSFATGGSDGFVNIWNRDSKRRLKSFPKFPTTISQLAFSPDGKYLAVAASYVYDQGEIDNPTHSVWIYPIYEADVNPSFK